MDLVQTVQSTFEAYQHFNQAHPLLASMATAEVIFPISDLISQRIKDGRISGKKTVYTSFLAPMYGLALYGLMKSGESIGLLWDNALAKAALGPNLGGNLLNALFLMNNTVGERSGYDIGQLVNHYKEIGVHVEVPNKGFKGYLAAVRKKVAENIPEREFLEFTAFTFTGWNVFQAVNYAYIPEELRTPFSLSAAFAWTVFMSWRSLIGSRRLVEKEE